MLKHCKGTDLDNSGLVSRSEFLTKCQALLAGSECPSTEELNLLFNVLDPRGTGVGHVRDFAMLVGASMDEVAGCAGPAESSPEDILRKACHQLRHGGSELRRDLLVSSWPAGLPEWISLEHADTLLRPHLAPAELSSLLHAVERASMAYQGTANTVRLETLLAFSEACDEHVLTIKLETLHGIRSLAALAHGDAPEEVFLRCRLHDVDCAVCTTGISLGLGGAHSAERLSTKLDLSATCAMQLSVGDRFADFFAHGRGVLTAEVWGKHSSGEEMLSMCTLSAVEVGAFVEADNGDTSSQVSWKTNLQFYRSLGDQVRILSSTSSSVCNGATGLQAGTLCISLSYIRKPPEEVSKAGSFSLPAKFHGEFAGSSIQQSYAAPSNGTLCEAGTLGSEHNDIDMNIHTSHITVDSSRLMLLAFESLGYESTVVAQATGLQYSIFASLQLFAVDSSRSCSVWSDMQLLPMPAASGPGRSTDRIDVSFPWQTTWPACMSTKHARDAVLELWLYAENQDTDSVAMRLAAQLVPLETFLDAALVDHLSRTKLSIPFEVEGKVLAEMEVEMTVTVRPPKSPTSEGDADHSLVVEEKPGSSDLSSDVIVPRKRPELSDRVVVMREVWLSLAMSGGLSAMLAQHAEPYYYVEVTSSTSGPQELCHRVVPAKASRAADSWMKLEFDCAELVVSVEPESGSCIPAAVIILNLFVLNENLGGGHQSGHMGMPSGYRCPLARASLELRAENACLASVQQHWLPLTSTLSGCGLVGRALIGVQTREASSSGEPARLLAHGLLLPAGILLPTGEVICSVEGDALLGEELDLTCQVALGEAMCNQLQQCEERLGPTQLSHVACQSRGWVQAEEFAACLWTHGYESDLNFFKDSFPYLFQNPEHFVPYVSLLHWVLIRVVARLIRSDIKHLSGMLQECDHNSCGTVTLNALREALATFSREVLPVGLQRFIEHWLPWRLSPSTLEGDHFDYVSFFSDLQMSGISGLNDTFPLEANDKGPVVARPSPLSLDSPQDKDMPLIALHIKRALHLPVVNSKSPNTFVAYSWQADDRLNGTLLETDLGRTEVIYRTTCPAWDSSVSVPLPMLYGERTHMTYPSAFQHLTLRLQVWHVELPAGDSRGMLVGTATVPLAPLLAGFSELDGYFHINAASDDGVGVTGSSSQQGQMYVKVIPSSASVIPDNISSFEACLPRKVVGSSLADATNIFESQAEETTLGIDEWEDQDAILFDTAVLAKSFSIPSASVAPAPETFWAERMTETELKIGSRLSSLEVAFSSSKESDEEQLQAMRECHRKNMAELEEVQRRLLCLSKDDFELSEDQLEPTAQEVQVLIPFATNLALATDENSAVARAAELALTSAIATQPPLIAHNMPADASIVTSSAAPFEVAHMSLLETQLESLAMSSVAGAAQQSPEVPSACLVPATFLGTSTRKNGAGLLATTRIDPADPAEMFGSAPQVVATQSDDFVVSVEQTAKSDALVTSDSNTHMELGFHVDTNSFSEAGSKGYADSFLVGEMPVSQPPAAVTYAGAGESLLAALLVALPSTQGEVAVGQCEDAGELGTQAAGTALPKSPAAEETTFLNLASQCGNGTDWVWEFASPTAPAVDSSTVDAGSQTELASPSRRETISSLLRESPGAVLLAGRCQQTSPVVKAEPKVWPSFSPSPLAAVDTTAGLTDTPWTEADSETASVVTSVAPKALQFKPKWSASLDLQTRRIARIMRGSECTGEDSEASSTDS